MEILYVNACLRTEASRTRRIAESFIAQCKRIAPDAVVKECRLAQERPEYLTPALLADRDELIEMQRFEHPLFTYAREFAAADRIVVAAPLYDLSFPAVLKAYLERVCVGGITFTYENDRPVGLCRAEKLMYITSRGGDFSGEMAEFEMGARYVHALCMMFGIPKFECIAADGLDIIGNDAAKMLEGAVEHARAAAPAFME